MELGTRNKAIRKELGIELGIELKQPYANSMANHVVFLEAHLL